jgi:hypothetical protein
MDAKEFGKQLGKIIDAADAQIIELVHKAQADEGLPWDTDMPVSWCGDPNWQRKADALVERAGWIYDRLRGRNRLAKQSVTKRLRKALGYTYP